MALSLLLSLLLCFLTAVDGFDLADYPITVSSPLPLPSSPVSSPNPSSTSLLTFDDIPQLTTCESATFKWNYTDSVTQQLIISIITDRNVSSSTPTTPVVNRVISSTVNPNLNVYTWPAVAVPEGWYKLYATIPARSFNATSADFLVKAGSDLSCLLSSSPTASSSKSSTVSIGAIVGGILGAAAFVLITAIMLLLYRRHRSDKQESRSSVYENGKRGRGGYGGNSRFFTRQKSWDNLGSIDSHVGNAPAGKDSQRLRYHHRHPISQASFADSVNLPVLEYGRNLSQKSFTVDEKEKGLVSPRESIAYAPRSRRPSDTSSLVASTALSHVMGPPKLAPPLYRSSSVSEAGSPLDTVPHQSKPHKSRKATRKPVPAYNPGADADAPPSLPPVPVSSSLDLHTQLPITDDPFARPLPAALIHKDSTTSLDILAGFNSAPASAHGHGHYMSRSQSTSSAKDRGLAHKHSFGGFENRPMHYLIPDMPLPQK